MGSPTEVPNALDWFTYPRLLRAGDTGILGYDLGYFLLGNYAVIGNSKTREMAEQVIRSNYHPKSITHEDEPSPSLQGQPRHT